MPSKQNVKMIVVHCAATRPDWMKGKPVEAKRNAIANWHKQRGWRDIGYHEVIDRDGSRTRGRAWHEVGAHVKGKNSISLGVCLLGGHGSNENDQFEEHFTPQQDAALREVIDEMRAWVGRDVPVRGHNEFAAKACPGFNAPRWFARKAPAKGWQTATGGAAGGAAAVAVGTRAVQDGLITNGQMMIGAAIGIAILLLVYLVKR